jgi:hypothetical protein
LARLASSLGELVDLRKEAVPSLSTQCTGTPAESRHPQSIRDDHSVFDHWRRAALVLPLAFCFALLVFGCKASLFRPANHLRCRVARIEVSVVPLKRSVLADPARYEHGSAHGACSSGAPAPAESLLNSQEPAHAILSDPAHQWGSPRSPPPAVQS